MSTEFKKSVFICSILMFFCNVIRVNSSDTSAPKDLDFINDDTSFFLVGCAWGSHIYGSICFSAYSGRFNLKQNKFVWKKRFSYWDFTSVAVSETLGHAAVQEEGERVIIRSLLDGKYIFSLHEDLSDMYFTPSGEYIFAKHMTRICTWKPTKYKNSNIYHYSFRSEIEIDFWEDVSWRPDGKQFALESDGIVRIFDLNNYKELFAIDLSAFIKYSHNNVLYSNNNKILLVSSRKDRFLRLFDTTNYKMIKEIEDNEVEYAKFSNDDNYIITCGLCDKPVNIWDVRDGKLLLSIDLKNQVCSSAGFFKNNKYIYVNGEGKRGNTIYIYKLDGTLVKEYKIKGEYILKTELIYD